MYYLNLATAVVLFISFLGDRRKTMAGMKMALKILSNILPALLTMLIAISIVLYLIPDRLILHYLGDSGRMVGLILASFFGSVTIMPGFIAFPLSGILLQKGVSYMVLAAFTTTLMMVGILTYPIESKYFGAKVTVVRNVISLLIALIVAVSIGYFFGELS